MFSDAQRLAGLPPDLRVSGYRAEDVVGALEGTDLTGAALLFAGAAGPREAVPELLCQRGARVDVALTFRTALVEGEEEGLAILFRDRPIDAVVFTSSSTVNRFLEALRAAEPASLLQQTAIACIGPMVSDTARRAGLPVHIQPDESSLAALREALVRHFVGGDGPWPS
jgi:uroporphyrinogen-III synthase